jgi:ubiquinone/menaquinone biosynthesis C-methylase UbiE
VKDNFSTNSDHYALFRPTYPKEIFTFINELDIPKNKVWDCGTGTGQVASVLAEIFERVEASDISQSQLENAIQKKNLFYSKEPAEKTNFLDSYFESFTSRCLYLDGSFVFK